MIKKGKITSWNDDKGFGFITQDNGEEIFVHFRSIRGEGRRGLRDGQLVFDLTPAQVTPERLAHLYDQHEDELRGETLPLASPEEALAAPAPVVMHCR